MAYTYLTINGAVCDGIDSPGHLPEPAHGGFSVAIQDVDSASTGRGADGNMIRDRVGVKAKIFLKFPPMTDGEMNRLLSAVSDVSFTVEYPSPVSGAGARGTFYVGDRTAAVYMMGNSGVSLWENVSFNLIEM